jgi:hypothetical protein
MKPYIKRNEAPLPVCWKCKEAGEYFLGEYLCKRTKEYKKPNERCGFYEIQAKYIDLGI